MINDNLLEKIISPSSLQDFMENYYGKKTLHIQRNNISYYDSIISASILDEILTSTILTEKNLRVSKIDKQILKKEYSVHDEFYNEDQINIGKMMELFNDGASIIIDNISKFNRNILDLEIEISKKIGYIKNISSNLYLTPSDCQAFPLHYDTSEIFIIQLAGTKTWELYEYSKEVYPLKNSINHTLPENTSCIKITLQPGDMIYMPRGVSHKVYTNDEPSLHLTISLFPQTFVDLFELMHTTLKNNDSNFRKNITKQTSVTEIKKLFTDSLDQTQLTVFLETLISRNRYSELYQYTDIINSIFEEVDFKKTDFKFRKYANINYSQGTSLILYGTKKVEIEGDFSNLKLFLNNDSVLNLENMKVHFEEELSEELLYLLLQEGIIYRIC
ncbi:MAG: cupin domain-containing protein [Flavobacterium sp.]